MWKSKNNKQISEQQTNFGKVKKKLVKLNPSFSDFTTHIISYKYFHS